MLGLTRFEDLPGWATHDHETAFETFRHSAREIIDAGAGFSRPVRFGGSRSAWTGLCRDALVAANGRQFFEGWFCPYHVKDAECPGGLFTGYFEPEVRGRLAPETGFQVPLYRKPSELPVPAYTRRDIEQGALAGLGLEIAWLSDWADAFFMQVQGSGRIRLQDGRVLRLTYDGKTGLPYTSIGGLLVERGSLLREDVSMQSIRSWMAEHPDHARKLMWENQSFVFFRLVELEHPERGALGAQHVQLTPRRSIAVDRSQWMFGTPIWLDTAIPVRNAGAREAFRQLMIAQDTGSAIKGLARGDVYWGAGEEAAMIAGHMKSEGTMTVLLPVTVAEELGLPV